MRFQVLSQSLRCLPHSFALLGIIGFSFQSGCDQGGGYAPVTEKEVEQAEAHVHEDEHHHHEAPHGGHLIELGDHLYNAEVVFEPNNERLVVYVLDAHAENTVAVPLEQIEFAVEGGEPITLAAEPQEGDAEGQASRFSATGETVAAIKDIEDLHGSVTVEINGDSYTGALEHDHDEHDHEGEAGHEH
ncbi:MAG: hypothetical protein KDA86_04760 [Planctomycetaceae bacterium]|nr:hypothetical protein [Planctomycetaceae bacterium]